MRIAIYGGAFNPVHNEHVNIASAAIRQLELDKLIVMPTFNSPHKSGRLIARAKDRLEACRYAFCGIDKVEVSDYEIKKGGISYSYLTCRHFRKLYSNDEIYFIIGTDMLESFRNWREPEEILKCVTLAVCARENERAFDCAIRKFRTEFKSGILKLNYVGKKVSSTEIRALASVGEDVAGLVPEKVRFLIRNKKLYEIPGISKVKHYLTENRWRHTLGVVKMAAENCGRVRAFEEDAVIAAALHDCAKYLSADAEELKGFTPPANVPPPVLHQYSGAYVAERTFGIKDAGVLNAIRYHTSARENMSGLEKLIYLSDMLEEGRSFDGVDELRKIFKRDIDECLFVALKRQLEYLKSTDGQIYPLTKRAFEYLKENYGQ